MPKLSNVLAVILGGGRGARLYPLTKLRSKPAVPIAGKYRLIDIPLSNCINSGIFRMHVLTQFNSVSLHRHISESYKFDVFHTGWVQVLAAEQTPTSEGWYQGTADAVRKQLFQIQVVGTEHVLILAGDHLYRMDYAPMVASHVASGSDITVAVQPVHRDEADRFGLLKREPGGRITSFVEKPKTPEAQAKMVSREDPERPYLGSMGIYLIRTDVLVDLLTSHPDFDDFGHHVIPYSIDRLKVSGFDFDGYWQDIGTIRSFYDVNLELTRPDAPFNLYDTQHPIYTHSRFLPGSICNDSKLSDVLLTEGCVVQQAEISHSIVGLRSQIGRNAFIKDSIVMGADYYQRQRDQAPLGIGSDCHIEGAILDKNASVGAGSIIKPFPRGTEMDHGDWVVQDGIVVVPKNAVLPAGTRIGPGF
ncbi:glucose-1-phosphate adenylyltransferase [Mesoterricola sediminis]|uniref:Glucose-1-phosphate adenylyltransferase n=1 Tax=Mesoterricola sediminis TaxID=2927980 RepID=A0AA48KDX4_9BACT|nr:glucose-1-phosphate adenylyltransferase [Mesoterricola sediminis]BDU78666.1 glucose-1-phosphate adenylyltransferase [Mesoterricola sediminis]